MLCVNEHNTMREQAMLWWNELGSDTKTLICDTHPELIGSIRRHETLTGREIEQLYKSIHGVVETTFADELIHDMENGKGLAKENLEKPRTW